MQPIGSGKANHPNEQRNLHLQQPAIIRTDQAGRSAHQKPSIGHSTDEERPDSNDAEIRKATSDFIGDRRSPRFIGVSQQSEQQRQRNETTKPSARCAEM